LAVPGCFLQPLNSYGGSKGGLKELLLHFGFVFVKQIMTQCNVSYALHLRLNLPNFNVKLYALEMYDPGGGAAGAFGN